jgi:hypothetical protein
MKGFLSVVNFYGSPFYIIWNYTMFQDVMTTSRTGGRGILQFHRIDFCVRIIHTGFADISDSGS